MLLKECIKTWTTYLLFALKNKLNMAVHQSMFNKIFKSLDLNQGLPLVVIRTASIQTAITNIGLPRVAVPEIQRLYWHHVVV